MGDRPSHRQPRRGWVAAIGLAGWLWALPAPVTGQDVSGSASLEVKGWFETPVFSEQRRASVSLMLQPEYQLAWGDRQRLRIAPFVRWDQVDSERTHWDIRELLWEHTADAWDLRAGVGRVFWGVTESQHLVDVINQTDFIENLDGEDKLGQSMVHLGLYRSWGTVELFGLPGFRTRTYPGPAGRPRFPLPIATGLTVFESGAGRTHVDVAARWSHVIGAADIGVAHFHGTSREPRFVVGTTADRQPVFIPHYDQIDQSSLDLSWVSSAWLWKLELINRGSEFERFAALTGGVEYTLSGVFASGAELGLMAEFLWDERGRLGQNPLDDEIFVASRLALNDVQGTELLSGIAVDRHSGASFVTIEGSRRFGNRWRINLEGRSFFAIPETDFLYPFRADDYLHLEIAWFL